MNKDVIYIEPEDDITDIITKIENSKPKIVALVPPKKAGVFRSVVNIKLIAKAANAAKKTVVLVTTDPPIVKLAAATRIPVAKNLQSAPTIPVFNDEEEESSTTEELREPAKKDTEEEAEESDSDSSEKTEEKSEESKDSDDNADDKEKGDAKESKKDKKKARAAKRSGNKFVAWFQDHKKLIIFGGIGGLILILLLIWALVIAPAATLTVDIKTDANNFSEAVTFTTKVNEENTDNSVFYLEEKKVESVKKVEFEATGQKNVGEKAHGNLVIYTYFKRSDVVKVPAGASFSYNGLYFTADEEVSLTWDGSTASDCENNGQTSAITSGCLISGRIKVTAVEPGGAYNIAASNTGWNTAADVAVYSDSAMSGGLDEMITVVTQADIDKAKENLTASDQDADKAKLFEEIGDDVVKIETSFTQKAEDAVSSPAIGEKVEQDKKPVLTVKTVTRIYVIDKTKVEEFITKKAKLSDDQKIYEIRDPFIENFTSTDTGYSGKLKTSYISGPKVTENSIVEVVKGKGLGEAQHDLHDINGVGDVHIDTSFPWVTSIPNDPNKITVVLKIKEQ